MKQRSTHFFSAYRLVIAAILVVFGLLFSILRAEAAVSVDMSLEDVMASVSLWNDAAPNENSLGSLDNLVEWDSADPNVPPKLKQATTLTLNGGTEPNDLSLFGGTQTLPAGTALPAGFTFYSDTTFISGVPYYVRTYISTDTMSFVVPGSTQAPRIIYGTGQAPEQGPLDVIVYNNPGVGQSPSLAEMQQGTSGGTGGAGIDVSGSTGGLVPCGNRGGAQCTFDDVLKLISNVINYIFLAIIPIAAVMFIIIGFQYMFSGGKVELKSMLKSRMGNLIFGIVIIMGAWLLMATILRTLGVQDSYILLDL